MRPIVLYDASGNPISLVNGVPVTSGMLIAGSDGTNAHALSVDAANGLGMTPIGGAGSAVPAKALLWGAKGGANLVAVDGDPGGFLSAAPYAMAGSLGLVTGGTYVIYGEMTIASVTPTLLMSTTYTEQAAAAQMNLISSSNFDKSSSTGLGTVRVTYYRSTGSSIVGPFTETVSLNGTTQVLMAETALAYVERFDGLTFGSNAGPRGTISIRNGVTAFWTLTASTTVSQAYAGHHYVPAGVTAYVYSISCACTGNSGRLDLVYKSYSGGPANNPEMPLARMRVSSTSLNTVQSPSLTPYVVPGPAKIYMRWTSDSVTSAIVYASYVVSEEA